MHCSIYIKGTFYFKGFCLMFCWWKVYQYKLIFKLFLSLVTLHNPSFVSHYYQEQTLPDSFHLILRMIFLAFISLSSVL